MRIVSTYGRLEGDALCWDWDWPFPAGFDVGQAFFIAIFDGFLKTVREDVNVVAVTLEGGWEAHEQGAQVKYIWDSILCFRAESEIGSVVRQRAASSDRQRDMEKKLKKPADSSLGQRTPI